MLEGERQDEVCLRFVWIKCNRKIRSLALDSLGRWLALESFDDVLRKI